MALKDYKAMIYGTAEDRRATIENYKFFDSIDFLPYLEQYSDFNEVIDALEQKYDNSEELPESCHGCFLNWVDRDEFRWYINYRYSDSFFITAIEKISYDYPIRKVN